MNATQNIDKVQAELIDWRGTVYAQLRELINNAQPDLEEDWKWDTAVWTAKGNVCALGVFKEHLKVNFFKGALIDDPKGLFNAGLDAKQSRSIDLREGDKIDELALRGLVRAAADYRPHKGQ